MMYTLGKVASVCAVNSESVWIVPSCQSFGPVSVYLRKPIMSRVCVPFEINKILILYNSNKVLSIILNRFLIIQTYFNDHVKRNSLSDDGKAISYGHAITGLDTFIEGHGIIFGCDVIVQTVSFSFGYICS